MRKSPAGYDLAGFVTLSYNRKMKSINFNEKFSLFSDQWAPKIIAGLNDYHFKLARIEGAFIWHSHSETDEAFIVLEGKMVMEYRDGSEQVKTGEMIVVPKGIEHRPNAKEECRILLIEPAGTRNTGETENEMTHEEVEWI
jgi:mannose-6-phosphate isomerase-like protein (cupin superfamily)